MLTHFTRYCFAQKKLVILRHGESIWNKGKKWAGWTDVPLSSNGIKQTKECANLIKQAGLTFDEIYTSVLSRTIKTANYIMDELNMHYLPVHKQWRLNEKHYGSLQGENKVQINQRYGSELVTSWRRSFDIPPPPLDVKDPRHPLNDVRYNSIPRELLPSSECLADIIKRIRPLFENEILPKIKDGKNLLIVAHGSSLRALVFLLDPSMNEEDIKNFNIPTATPIVWTFDDDCKLISKEFLGDEEEINIRMAKIKTETQKNLLED